jgi:hypothetical protein
MSRNTILVEKLIDVVRNFSTYDGYLCCVNGNLREVIRKYRDEDTEHVYEIIDRMRESYIGFVSEIIHPHKPTVKYLGHGGVHICHTGFDGVTLDTAWYTTLRDGGHTHTNQWLYECRLYLTAITHYWSATPSLGLNEVYHAAREDVLEDQATLAKWIDSYRKGRHLD